jgi:hypothetical protein
MYSILTVKMLSPPGTENMGFWLKNTCGTTYLFSNLVVLELFTVETIYKEIIFRGLGSRTIKDVAV